MRGTPIATLAGPAPAFPTPTAMTFPGRTRPSWPPSRGGSSAHRGKRHRPPNSPPVRQSSKKGKITGTVTPGQSTRGAPRAFIQGGMLPAHLSALFPLQVRQPSQPASLPTSDSRPAARGAHLGLADTVPASDQSRSLWRCTLACKVEEQKSFMLLHPRVGPVMGPRGRQFTAAHLTGGSEAESSYTTLVCSGGLPHHTTPEDVLSAVNMAARDYFSQHPLGGGEAAQDLERAYLQHVEDEATGQERTVLVLEILFTKGHHHVANILLQRLISVAPEQRGSGQTAPLKWEVAHPEWHACAQDTTIYVSVQDGTGRQLLAGMTSDEAAALAAAITIYASGLLDNGALTEEQHDVLEEVLTAWSFAAIEKPSTEGYTMTVRTESLNAMVFLLDLHKWVLPLPKSASGDPQSLSITLAMDRSEIEGSAQPAHTQAKAAYIYRKRMEVPKSAQITRGPSPND